MKTKLPTPRRFGVMALAVILLTSCGDGGRQGSLGESGRILTSMFEAMHSRQIGPLATIAERACQTQDDDESLSGVSAYGESILRLKRNEVALTMLEAAQVWRELGWDVDTFLDQPRLRSRSVYARRGELTAGLEVEAVSPTQVTLRLFGISDCFPT